MCHIWLEKDWQDEHNARGMWEESILREQHAACLCVVWSAFPNFLTIFCYGIVVFLPLRQDNARLADWSYPSLTLGGA
jgi:hypothetical protein